MKNILDIASDISETISICADDQNSSETTQMINENGEFAFLCQIVVSHDYYAGDRKTGEAYEFDVTNVMVEVLNAYDEDGQEIAINSHEKRQIQKFLEMNLTFEITKK